MNIKDLIPQREPFLFIQEIQEIQDKSISVSMNFSEDMDFFQGHFPGNPVVPGVILTEHCLQSGAALINSLNQGELTNKLAVVSRINSAKFKQMVKPGEMISTTTELVEQMGNAAFFKSIIKNQDNKKVLILEFACNLVE